MRIIRFALCPGEEENLELQWGLDPVHKTVARVLIRDLLECHPVQDAPGYFRLGQHVVKRMEVLGYVVAVQPRHNRVDLTGTLALLSRPLACTSSRPSGCIYSIVLYSGR